MQIGGSDQWGNIVNGVELIKRQSGNQVYGLTTPLITLASGAKMGKTEKGAVWLDKKLLSSYDYWQFWRNTDDRDVVKFLKMFTDKDVSEIESIKDKNINDLKTLLANEATTLLHGKAAAVKASDTAKKSAPSATHGNKQSPDSTGHIYKIIESQVRNALNESLSPYMLVSDRSRTVKFVRDTKLLISPVTVVLDKQIRFKPTNVFK